MGRDLAKSFLLQGGRLRKLEISNSSRLPPQDLIEQGPKLREICFGLTDIRPPLTSLIDFKLFQNMSNGILLFYTLIEVVLCLPMAHVSYGCVGR